ncbi:MAG: sulfatase [Planctomycetota bacterium]
MDRLFVWTVVAVCGGAAAAGSPNVLFIAVDDLRPELGCYGATQVLSPHIDAFAETATVFERGYCNIPVCGASRASLMTGILPTADRFKTFYARADEDVPGAVTLPQRFKEAGYRTVSVGKILHVPRDTEEVSWSEPAWRPKGRSWQRWFDPTGPFSRGPEPKKKPKHGPVAGSADVDDSETQDGMIADKAIAELQTAAAGDAPFFLACGFFKPHMPFYAPKRYWDLYERDAIELADNRFRPRNAPDGLHSGSKEYRSYILGDYKDDSDRFHRMMRHGYFACVSFIDAQIGRVLDELDRLGLAEDTVVVLWGDHGWHLGEHEFWGKHNTLHNALRVPFVVRMPGGDAGRSTALVETIDLFPTLCELAGLSTPASVQGRSFAGLLDGRETTHRDHIYSRFVRADAVVTERFAYSEYRNPKTADVTGRMLYDHASDPDENVNVVDEPAYEAEVARLAALVAERMREADAASW